MSRPRARCVVFLQNAWSPEFAGRRWPRDAWLDALGRSMTGRRLALVFPDPAGVWFDNASPEVADTPGGLRRADPGHVSAVLRKTRPAFVVTCGKQAEATTLPLWPGRLIVLPHPNARGVTNALFLAARDAVLADDFDRVRFRQTPGGVLRSPLDV